ncbi:MAG: hypothetical protein A3C50_01100 [Candidatus Staskawiczbacteria bacterium RIFCSPHIGHO2_02_FULL_43_16]|uniref:Uncharacterized protein n=1 Tax=Candidatus Staskawiczbacteria bacterium RIFCSPHIGHO2_01_FULL_41_41 TaxID=1802203 RepID=A0A1G2HWY3_9BACT|nr:MAG: hypothetical protein A2822_04790 [Candidatus Staskawiczbacteria bacterium RIFCSPHIGHO2_01_FULL_41_41]OGZ68398.1 MAG: hypothetical protein A3C50_01100 [Candidatus Staskawiczbacteria bacterium RIFCSPHIGHO2_02_FULL_43_16]OGZ74184.1 MAG: hypothetical protein A3A12_00115 [Candidatus Staskawiczbacteria bacterium RIFCSPLOWO2_01_FULL_43_17b]
MPKQENLPDPEKVDGSTQYYYEAMKADGTEVTGSVAAESKDEAEKEIRGRGLFVAKLMGESEKPESEEIEPSQQEEEPKKQVEKMEDVESFEDLSELVDKKQKDEEKRGRIKSIVETAKANLDVFIKENDEASFEDFLDSEKSLLKPLNEKLRNKLVELLKSQAENSLAKKENRQKEEERQTGEAEEIDVRKKELEGKFEEAKDDTENEEKFDHWSDMAGLKSVIESNGGKAWGQLDDVMSKIFYDMERKIKKDNEITSGDIELCITDANIAMKYFYKKDIPQDTMDALVKFFEKRVPLLTEQVKNTREWEKKNPRKQWYQFWKKGR